ncbi:MAG: TlpA family protein disulfide reductase [Aquificae bacterium]|nr:TlpA family protein disulfide reductase [Aquificota bacterium]
MWKIVLNLVIVFFIATPSTAGLKAFDFTLKTIDGKTVKLSDYKGNVVILIFWSTKCPSCERELPKLWKWYQEKYKNKNVKILTIVVDTHNKKKIKKVIQKWNFGFPVLLPDSKVIKKYFVPGTPTFYILRKDLTVGKILFGEQKLETLEKLIEKFLKE